MWSFQTNRFDAPNSGGTEMGLAAKVDFWELADEFYGEIPEYVVKPGRSFITIMTGNEWENNPKPLKVTIADVVRYFADEAGNMMSGIRTLAGFSSDWRGIDQLAQECLNWFQFVNIDHLRRLSRKAGLIPKFEAVVARAKLTELKQELWHIVNMEKSYYFVSDAYVEFAFGADSYQLGYAQPDSKFTYSFVVADLTAYGKEDGAGNDINFDGDGDDGLSVHVDGTEGVIFGSGDSDFTW